jgi:hypothetical protein
LVSTVDVRQYAEEAEQPFETGVMYIALGQLIVAMHWPRMGFHDDEGCILDYNANRHNVVRGLRRPAIDRRCYSLLRPAMRQPIARLLSLLQVWRPSQ